MTSSVNLVEPAFLSLPPSSKSYGGEVADLAALAGFTPDLEQRLILDALFAVDVHDRPAAFEAAIICGRQNLKTGVLKMAALGWLWIIPNDLIVWSAHEFSTAQEAFRDLTILIESCPDLDREVKAIHRGNGDEAIELLSGQRVRFRARTKGGGRGLSGDKVILDEAFALKPVHMGALLPTLSARPEPQVVYASSAGLNESAVLRGVRDRGRAGGDPSLTYVEWCDPDRDGCRDGVECVHALGQPGCALDDPARWGLANPALGRRISVEYVAAERRALPAHEFARERLGWWDDPLELERDISSAAWAACGDSDAFPQNPIFLGLDAAPNLSSAAIVACGVGADGLPVVEVVQARRGVAWVLDVLPAIVVKQQPRAVGVLPGSPAGALIDELDRAKVRLVHVDGSSFVQACGGFVKDVLEAQLRHREQDSLTNAVLAAQRRHVGDAWKWSRRDSNSDISPLVAATIARGLFVSQNSGVRDVSINVW